MALYNPPSYNQVNFNHTNNYVIPSFDQVNFNHSDSSGAFILIEIDFIDGGTVNTIDWKGPPQIVISEQIDSSDIFNLLSIINIDQFVTTKLIYDLFAQFFSPNKVFNLRTIIDKIYFIDSSTFYNPSRIENKIQYHEISSVINQSTVHPPYKSFNLNQRIKINFFDQSIVNEDNIELLRRYFSADNTLNLSSIYPPFAENIDRYFFIEQTNDISDVYSPNVFNLLQFFNASQFSQYQIFSPNIYNADIDIMPETIDNSTVYENDIVLLDIFVDTNFSDFCEFYSPFDISNKIRYFILFTIQDESIVYDIESIRNKNSVITIEFTQNEEVFAIESIENKNQEIFVDFFDIFGFFPLENIENFDKVINGEVFEAIEVFDPFISNFRREFIPQIIDDSSISSDISVQLAPQAILDEVFYEGCYALCEIDHITHARIFAFAYTGNYLDIIFTPAVTHNLNLIIYAGEYCPDLIIVDDFIGISTFIFEGVFTTFDGLEFEPLIKIYEGSNTEIELMIHRIFKEDVYLGETCDFELTTYESSPLQEESIKVYVDFSGISNFNNIISFYLTPYTIKTIPDIIFDNFDLYPFIVDTTLDCACSKPRILEHSNLNFEFENEVPIFEDFVGEKQYAYFELHCRKFIEAVVYTGEVFYTNEYKSKILELYDIAGEFITSYCDIDFEVINFKLCPGNFISDGENVPIEIIDLTGNECGETHFIREGETVELILSCEYNLYLQPIITDMHMFTFLEVYHERYYAFIDFHVYSHLTTDNNTIIEIPNNSVSSQNLTIDVYSGSTLLVKFYEENFDVFTGEYVEAKITIEYSIEFLEAGVLPNEYVYMDENGLIDKEKTTNLCLELKPYRHDLKAKCFI